jgi:hypothetical protein
VCEFLDSPVINKSIECFPNTGTATDEHFRPPSVLGDEYVENINKSLF